MESLWRLLWLLYSEVTFLHYTNIQLDACGTCVGISRNELRTRVLRLHRPQAPQKRHIPLICVYHWSLSEDFLWVTHSQGIFPSFPLQFSSESKRLRFCMRISKRRASLLLTSLARIMKQTSWEPSWPLRDFFQPLFHFCSPEIKGCTLNFSTTGSHLLLPLSLYERLLDDRRSVPVIRMFLVMW